MGAVRLRTEKTLEPKVQKPEMSGTVCNALRLLNHFNCRQRQIGLTQLSSLSGYDKAKVRRYMLALMECGLVEQYPATREYRIGASVHRLASIREADFSLQESIDTALQRLSGATQETAHCSQLCGSQLANMGVVESPHANRVSLAPGMILPFHATASGMALLAFAERDFAESILAQDDLEACTEATLTSQAELLAKLEASRADGFATSHEGYEAGVNSIAMPTFGEAGLATGAVSVAAPTVRMDPRRAQEYIPALLEAARFITQAQRGRYPDDYPFAAGAKAA